MLLLNSLILIGVSYAQDQYDVYTHIRKNEKAPFDGTLLTPSSLSTVISTYDSKISLCENEKNKVEETLNAKYEVFKNKCEFDYKNLQQTDLTLLKAKQEEIEALREIAKKTNKNLTPLWIGVGFASGFAASIGSIYVYDLITK